MGKIKLSNGLFRSISHVQTVKKSDYKELVDTFLIFWSLKSEGYHITKLDSIIFTYKIIPLNSEITKSKISSPPNIKEEKKSNFNFGGYNLPLTMDLTS